MHCRPQELTLVHIRMHVYAQVTGQRVKPVDLYRCGNTVFVRRAMDGLLICAQVPYYGIATYASKQAIVKLNADGWHMATGNHYNHHMLAH